MMPQEILIDCPKNPSQGNINLIEIENHSNEARFVLPLVKEKD